jgi:hypothetical protein
MRRLALLLTCAGLALLPVTQIGAVSVKPKDGRYAGKTVQGYAVKFKVRKGIVTGQLFKITGSGGCSFTVYATSAGKVSATGRFKLTQDVMTIKGRFVTPTKVKGTISDPECTSAPAGVAFTAKRVG